MNRPTPYEVVIGLEVHVQLRTSQKLFCAVSTGFGAPPNTQVDPVTLALPGALPVLNGEAVDLGVRAALGLGCTVHAESIFARKHYFYPDLPKGYQISQFDRPIATDGVVAVEGDDAMPGFTVRIRRLHLEEDAGKSVHDRFPTSTGVDLNRTGVPLAEIVTEPDFRSPSQVTAYLDELKRILEYLDVSDCNMEEGSLRVDANVSIRPEGADTLGTKTELKNMNSFSAIEKALVAEIARQRETVEAGGEITQDTLLWDPKSNSIRVMRSKEESHDYRYLPDPDLPPLRLTPERMSAIESQLPELPAARRRRFAAEYGLPTYDISVLTARRPLGDYFEAVVGEGIDPKSASNWVMGSMLELANREGRAVDEVGLSPSALSEVIGLVDDGTISHASGKQVLAQMLETGLEAKEVVEREGLAQISDSDAIQRWVLEIVASHPDEVSRYRSGDAKVFGFLIGQAMKLSKGAANPREINRALREALDSP